jgi:hypothetical protein
VDWLGFQLARPWHPQGILANAPGFHTGLYRALLSSAWNNGELKNVSADWNVFAGQRRPFQYHAELNNYG